MRPKIGQHADWINRDDWNHIVASATNASATANVRQSRIRINTAAAAFALTLPHPAECDGKVFDIVAPNGATNAVTLKDHEGSTLKSLDAAGDYATVLSVGDAWRILVSNA